MSLAVMRAREGQNEVTNYDARRVAEIADWLLKDGGDISEKSHHVRNVLSVHLDRICVEEIGETHTDWLHRKLQQALAKHGKTGTDGEENSLAMALRMVLGHPAYKLMPQRGAIRHMPVQQQQRPQHTITQTFQQMGQTCDL